MNPALRKAMLTAHVTSSVGWLGAVACFLALSIAGLASADAQVVRGCYLAMAVLAWSLIVPASAATLATGIIQAVGTPWGLVRHYWVFAKLFLTVLATAVLLIHTAPIGELAQRAAAGTLLEAAARSSRVQLVADAGGALLVLLLATVLSVYKPRGMTRYGWRRRATSTIEP